jgi:hypothetical protein
LTVASLRRPDELRDVQWRTTSGRGSTTAVVQCPPKSRIPSEQHWVEETGFARDTIRKAMALLVSEGRIYIVRGLGTIVA